MKQVKFDIRMVPIALVALFLCYAAWVKMQGMGSASRCDSACGKLKSMMIDNRCHCSTAAGWTPSKSATWIDRKVTGKK